jgi:hypothetical protein
MKLNEAAKLLVNKTHAIKDDCGNFYLLKKVLKVAFPNDKLTDSFEFNRCDNFYGACIHEKDSWANIGSYIKDLKIINLSDIETKKAEQKSVKISDLPTYSQIEYNSEAEFEKVVDETLQQIRETLIAKGKEYRRNNNPFHNFEVGARKKNITREKVLDGMLLKHEISIEDITNDLDSGKLPTEAVVNEKFGDVLIYLILKKAMFLQRILNK